MVCGQRDPTHDRKHPLDIISGDSDASDMEEADGLDRIAYLPRELVGRRILTEVNEGDRAGRHACCVEVLSWFSR